MSNDGLSSFDALVKRLSACTVAANARISQPRAIAPAYNAACSTSASWRLERLRLLSV